MFGSVAVVLGLLCPSCFPEEDRDFVTILEAEQPETIDPCI